MRRLDVLIEQSRRQTDNTDYSTNSGIQTEEFIQYANDAQDRIQSLALGAHPEGVFDKEKIYSVIASQDSYDLPFDIFLGSRVTSIFFSSTGSERDYYILDNRRDRERVHGVVGVPEFYTRKNGKVYLSPAPQSSSAKMKMTYERALPRLDVRRAQVSSVVLTGSAITSLVLVTGASLDSVGLSKDNYFSVIDRNGVVKMTRIPFDSINTGTGAVTISAGFTFESGESIAAGDYLCSGKNASTHSGLPDNAERYLISYMNWKILKRDSSNDSIEQSTELKELETDIVSSFAEPDHDVDQIPILDQGFLDTEPY